MIMSAKRVYPRRDWVYLRMITTHARKKEARRNCQVFRNLSPLPSRFADWLQRFCRQLLIRMKKASKHQIFCRRSSLLLTNRLLPPTLSCMKPRQFFPHAEQTFEIFPGSEWRFLCTCKTVRSTLSESGVPKKGRVSL